jgi:hypothetical protein
MSQALRAGQALADGGKHLKEPVPRPALVCAPLPGTMHMAPANEGEIKETLA